MNIEISKLNACYSEFEVSNNRETNPTWHEIENAIKDLEKSDGTIELFEKNKREVKGSEGLDITIAGTPGTYLTFVHYNIRNYYEADTKILTDVRIEAAEDQLVGMHGNECRKDHTVNDIEAVVKAVKALLETGKFVDSKPYVWIDLVPG